MEIPIWYLMVAAILSLTNFQDESKSIWLGEGNYISKPYEKKSECTDNAKFLNKQRMKKGDINLHYYCKEGFRYTAK